MTNLDALAKAALAGCVERGQIWKAADDAEVEVLQVGRSAVNGDLWVVYRCVNEFIDPTVWVRPIEDFRQYHKRGAR